MIGIPPFIQPPLAILFLELLCERLLYERVRRAVYKQRWIDRHPGRLDEFRRQYINRARQRDPEKWRARDRKRYKARYEKRKLQYEIKKDSINATRRKRRVSNQEDYRAKRRERYGADKQKPMFRIRLYLRNRLRRLFSEQRRELTDLIGCSWEQLTIHLESHFAEGMNWGNYGKFGWHIDHRVPCATFDLSKEAQVRSCFHWTNLQPLWWRDNLSKRERIGHQFGNQQPVLGI